jgi:hypothetical protein
MQLAALLPGADRLIALDDAPGRWQDHMMFQRLNPEP